MRITIQLYIIILFIVTCPALFGQGTLAPKYSNEFLSIGVGARGLGLSNAQVASIDDVTAGYWNPAGLAFQTNKNEIAAMHSEYFAGIAKYDYAGISRQLDSSSTASFTVIRFGVDDIPNTTELIDAGGNIDYSRITTFSAADYAFVFSYGKRAARIQEWIQNKWGTTTGSAQQEGLSWGVNAKLIYRHIGSFAKAWGFGIDGGMQYKRGPWCAGLMARDITTSFNAWSYNLSDKVKEVFVSTGNEIPSNGLEITLPRFTLGVGRSFSWKQWGALVETNATLTTDGQRNVLVSSSAFNLDPSIGAEIHYKKQIFLRAGIGNFQRITEFDQSQSMTFQPNIGLGLRIKRLYIDYALSDIGNVSDVLYSNVFSLRLNW